MTKRYYTYLLGILTTLLAVTLSSCADDSAEGGGSVGKGMVKVKGVIATRGGLTTRSTYVDAANNNELINDWIIVMAQSGTIKKIVTRDDYKDYAVEKEAFEFVVPAGAYDVYSFANISKTGLETAVGSTLSEGSTLPDLSAATLDITSVINNGTAVGSLGTTNIPMSGYKQATFTASGNQAEEFEVIRMMAKIEFTFKNASSKDITIKYVSMNPVNKGLIPLLPNYTTLAYNAEKNPVLLTSVVTTETVTDTYPTGAKLTKNSYSTTESYTRGFYLRESLAASNPSGLFTFNIGIEREDKSEEVLYTLSDASFTGINRNDYVKVPIKFTDYIVSLDANFYPPIGGYPAIIKEDKDKDEFYITFKTQGEFEILPTVYNASTGTNVYYPHWDYNSTTVKVTGDDIFTVPPHIDTTTGELLGKLSTSEGTAVIDVEITVEVSSGVWQVYTRRIYIIRKN